MKLVSDSKDKLVLRLAFSSSDLPFQRIRNDRIYLEGSDSADIEILVMSERSLNLEDVLETRYYLKWRVRRGDAV